MPSPSPDAARSGARRPADHPVAWQDDPRSVQILSAEHASLASTRSLVYNEAFTRVGVFLTFMSMSFVALALFTSATPSGSSFLGVTAVALAFNFLVGLMTLGRILGTTADDLRAVHAMARIRHGYLQVRPELRPFITTPVNDDIATVMRDYRAPSPGVGGALYSLTTSTGMVAVVDALLGGVLAGVLALLLGIGGTAAVVIGVIGTLLVFAAVAAGAARFILRDQASLEPAFPAPAVEVTDE
jgi:hypothetical protein